MRIPRVAPRTIILPSVIMMLLALLPLSTIHAENVPLSLTLIAPANPNTNRADVDFTIDIVAPAFNQTESTQTDISGSLSALADIDFAPGTHEATVNSIFFSPGALSYTDMTVTFAVPGLGSVDINTTNVAGNLNTPGGPSPVDGAGDFAAALQRAVLNAGVVSTFPPIQADRDFAFDPLMELLDAGTANIAVTKNGLPVGMMQNYDVSVSIPFAFSSTQMVDITNPLGGTIPANETLAMMGTIVATGSFVHTVPEPASVVLSIIGAVLAVFIVRRK